mgnify:FL=1
MRLMIKLLLMLIITLTYSSVTHAAENYKKGDKLFVANFNGLNLRKSKSLDSKILINLNYNSKIEIVDDSLLLNPIGLWVKGIIENKQIKLYGHWVKIKYENHVGYVFDGMLTKFYDTKSGDWFNYADVFGKPKVEVMKKMTKPIKGIKYPIETTIKHYSNYLIEEETAFDGCWDFKQTFKNISFNEVYWLIVKDMIGADAVQEIKLQKTQNSIVLTYYSCT